MRGFDYTGAATYFVTICTANRTFRFGAVVDGEMRLSPAGRIACSEWQTSADMRREIVPHGFVVMPNHVHGLVSFWPEGESPSFEGDQAILQLASRSLGAFINAYKGAVTRAIQTAIPNLPLPVWQRNYHDRIIRNVREFEIVVGYIETNPQRWHEDRFNPEKPM